jgi:hypothetical protein
MRPYLVYRKKNHSRISHDHDDDRRPVLADTFQHHSRKDGHLARVEQEERDDRRVSMSADDEPELSKTRAEVPRVESQASESFASLGTVEQGGREVHPGRQVVRWGGTVDRGTGLVGHLQGREIGVRGRRVQGEGWLVNGRARGGGEGRRDAHDRSHGRDNLGQDGRRDGLGIGHRVGLDANPIDDILVARDVAACKASEKSLAVIHPHAKRLSLDVPEAPNDLVKVPIRISIHLGSTPK